MKLGENREKPPLNNFMMALAAASMFAQIAFAQPALLVDTGFGSTGGAALFGTGSPGCTPQPACAAHFQYDAGQFTLPNGATLDSVQAYAFVGGPMSMVVRLYTDNNGVPGTSIFSKTYPLDFGPYRWVVFAGSTRFSGLEPIGWHSNLRVVRAIKLRCWAPLPTHSRTMPTTLTGTRGIGTSLCPDRPRRSAFVFWARPRPLPPSPRGLSRG